MNLVKRSVVVLFAVLLTIAMSSSILAMTAYADDTYSVTVTQNEKDTGTHTYGAYQIFKGDLGSDGSLSNIQWGDNISEAGKTALGDAKTYAASLSGKTADEMKAIAKTLNGYLTGDPKATATGTGNQTLTGLTAGYYLIKDTTNPTGDNSAMTDVILKVIKNETVNAKSDIPSVTKEISDTAANQNATAAQSKAAAYDIGDSIPYTLTATLPSNYDSYVRYLVQFNDEMSTGLTNNEDAKVYVVNGTTETEITSSATITNEAHALTVSIADLKALSGVTITSATKIVVKYTATLNNDAAIGSEGNTNDVELVYSNNPNDSGEGTPDTGKTPKDTTVVFTFKSTVDKVDPDNKALKGAAFKLEKKDANGDYQVVKTFTAGDATSFTFTGLGDGTYKLTETTTPDGYNTIDPIEFKIVSTEDQTKQELSDLKVTDLEGNALTSPITFTVTKSAGTLNTTVVNEKGSTLPSTGGIGTKLLYVLGGILVVVAGTVIVARRRASGEEE